MEVLRLGIEVPGLEEYDVFAVRRRNGAAPAPGANGLAVHGAPSSERIRVGQLEIDTGSRVVRRRGHAVALPNQAFNVLVALARRAGAVATRRDLLRDVWGLRHRRNGARRVDTTVWQIRQRLEDDPARPRYVLTVTKHGYRLVDPVEQARSA